MIRILIADDQDDIRSGFRLVLDSQPDMTVVGEAADGTTAVAKARELAPDVVLADIRMPGLDGLEVTRLLAATTKVIVVTTFDLDDYVHTALRNGACGFLLKRSGPTLLIEAVRAAMAGDTLLAAGLPADTILVEASRRAVPSSIAGYRPGPRWASSAPPPADSASASRPRRRHCGGPRLSTRHRHVED
ncbi:response regulator transcription factor [Micromonospora sp. CPCC 205371]|nr:response regulator transcription factor [Micromonospora sp. CPCC 205371]